MLSHLFSALSSIAVHVGAVLAAGAVVALLATYSGAHLIGTRPDEGDAATPEGQ
jgi:hypothetical protein